MTKLLKTLSALTLAVACISGCSREDARAPDPSVRAVLANAVSQPEPYVLSAEDCRRLATYGWELELNDGEGRTVKRGAAEIARQLTIAAARCPKSETVAHARLALHALTFALEAESAKIARGERASLALSERLRGLTLLLTHPEQVQSNFDLLIRFDPALFDAVNLEGPDFARAFRKVWATALAEATPSADARADSVQ